MHLQGKYFEGDKIYFVIILVFVFYAQRWNSLWTDSYSSLENPTIDNKATIQGGPKVGIQLLKVGFRFKK